MMKETIIEDSELGCLIVRVNPRVRSLVFRTKREAVYVSVPLGTTLKEVKQAIENLRGRLLASRQKMGRQLIDLKLSFSSCLWYPERKTAFWQIHDWALCKSFVRLMRTLRTKICRIGCVRRLKNQ